MLALGAVLFASWRYADTHGLLKGEVSAETACAVERRIVVAQGLYALGVLLCVLNMYWSIGFIVLVQLNYAIAPRLGKLSLP